MEKDKSIDEQKEQWIDAFSDKGSDQQKNEDAEQWIDAFKE